MLFKKSNVAYTAGINLYIDIFTKYDYSVYITAFFSCGSPQRVLQATMNLSDLKGDNSV